MKPNNTWFQLSVISTILITVTSVTGLARDEIYIAESVNWRAQARAQDLVNLAIVMPLLLVSGYQSRLYSRLYRSIFAGIQLFLIYSFLIYCFSIHFNQLFLAYCMMLSVSLYSFVYYLFQMRSSHAERWYLRNTPSKTFGIYLMAVSVFFFFLWIFQILLAVVSGTIMRQVLDAQLPVNPVHVIDLSIFLPGVYMVGWMLVKKKSIGYLLLIPVFTFLLLMDANILIIQLNLYGPVNQTPDKMLWATLVLLVLTILFCVRLFNSLRLRIRLPNDLPTPIKRLPEKDF